MFDFGAPVGFRLATRHPDRIETLVIQNGNAYEAGLGPNMQGLRPYWANRAANEAAIRGVLQLDVTRSQYVDGVPDPVTINPDGWELDQRYLDLPGRDRVMLDLLFDYQNNIDLYPSWQEYLRTHSRRRCWRGARTTPTSRRAGARAYLQDLPAAELHLLDTGHFASATHSREIAEPHQRVLRAALEVEEMFSSWQAF